MYAQSRGKPEGQVFSRSSPKPCGWSQLDTSVGAEKLLATELPSYISSEVFLSFIGVGLSAEIPSLGRMIQQAQSAFLVYPWEFWPPVAIASAITVILYVLGQNLADASDPRTHM